MVRRRRGEERPAGEITWRLFCALPIEAAVAARIQETLEPVRSQLVRFRWLGPESWHVTLQFYGDVPTSRLDDLQATLARACRPAVPVDAEIRGMGAFPDMRGPRVVWVGVRDAAGVLRELHERIQDAGVELGFQRENRRFHPHVTVARARRSPAGPIARELAPYLDRPIAPVRFPHVALYRSTLTEGGARYEVLQRFELAGGPR